MASAAVTASVEQAIAQTLRSPEALRWALVRIERRMASEIAEEQLVAMLNARTSVRARRRARTPKSTPAALQAATGNAALGAVDGAALRALTCMWAGCQAPLMTVYELALHMVHAHERDGDTAAATPSRDGDEPSDESPPASPADGSDADDSDAGEAWLQSSTASTSLAPPTSDALSSSQADPPLAGPPRTP